MRSNNTGTADHYVLLGWNSNHPHGGHDLEPPEAVSRRVQVRSTDHPSTDLWVSLTTVREGCGYVYRVALVNGFNGAAQPPQDFPTLRRALTAANRLYNSMKEDH